MKKSFLLVILVILSCLNSVNSQCPHQDGTLVSWSSAFGASQDVTITSGQKIKLSSTITINSLTIAGTLVFDEVNVNLTARWIRVNSGGSFIIGSSTCPYQSKAIITFTGSRTNNNDIGNAADGIAFGTKGLAVDIGGNLELFGRLYTPSWTKLSATANAGATVIQVADPVNWRAGDQIVIAGTDRVSTQNEWKTISSISGRDITIVGTLSFTHWGKDYERAEVGLLTRNIVFQGDNDNDYFGGHLMIRAANSVHIQGVEFTRMGQMGILGRYPVHFHLLGDVIARGFYAKDNSIHHNFQRCLVIHDSNGILVQGNVAFSTFGHCYFLEDGPEMFNTFDSNLGILAMAINNTRKIIPSDDKPSIFWISNPNNTYTGNSASSGFHGFWFAMPERPNGVSATKYASNIYMYPRFLPLLRFQNNIAHSLENGLFIDDMPDENGNVALASYEPRSVSDPYLGYAQYPIDENRWRKKGSVANFENFLSYKCRSNCIWTRGGYIRIVDSKLLDCQTAVQLVPGPNIVEDTLIVGVSENVGVPRNDATPVRGYEHYDASGPQFIRNVVFHNFTTTQARPAGAMGSLRNAKNMLHPHNRMEKLTFINANQFYQEIYPNTVINQQPKDSPKTLAVLDLDGSTTGSYGSWIVANYPITNRGGSSECVLNNNWNMVVCPSILETYMQMEVANLDTGNTNFGTTVTNNEFVRATWYAFGSTRASALNITGGDWDSSVRTYYGNNVPSRRGYQIQFPHPTPPKLSLRLFGAALGEWVVFAIPYPSTTFTITNRDNVPLTSTNNINNLDEKTYFYDSSSQNLFVKVYQTNQYTVDELWSFSRQTDYYVGVSVTAGCGNACTVGSPVIPPALVYNEDRYKAVMRGCNVVPSLNNNNEGTAFFSYNPKNKLLYYNILHNIDSTVVTKAFIGRGSESTDGVMVSRLNSAISPIRGSISLSRNELIDLWRGLFYVSIATTSNPNGVIRGQIGCVGSCSTPPSISSVDPCSPLGQSIVLYDDAIPNWSSWSYGQYKLNFSNTNDLLCGTKNTYLWLNASSALSYHKNAPSPIAIDTSIYKFFQFYVKSLNGNINLQVSFQNGGTTLGTIQVVPKHIDNWVIQETWTRVRLPFAEMGITGTANMDRINIYLYRNWDPMVPPSAMLLDEVRFASDNSEPQTPAVTGGPVSFVERTCSGTPPPTPVTTRSPPVTSQSVTTRSAPPPPASSTTGVQTPPPAGSTTRSSPPASSTTGVQTPPPASSTTRSPPPASSTTGVQTPPPASSTTGVQTPPPVGSTTGVSPSASTTGALTGVCDSNNDCTSVDPNSQCVDNHCYCKMGYSIVNRVCTLPVMNEGVRFQTNVFMVLFTTLIFFLIF